MSTGLCPVFVSCLRHFGSSSTSSSYGKAAEDGSSQCTHKEDPEETSASLLQMSSSLATAAICGVNQCMEGHLSVSLLKICFSKKSIRQRDRERSIFHPAIHSPNGPSRSPTWMAAPQLQELSSAAFSGATVGSWVGAEQPRPRTGSRLWDASVKATV